MSEIAQQDYSKCLASAAEIIPCACDYVDRTIQSVGTAGQELSKYLGLCRQKIFYISVKGTVARDFRPLVFFMNGPNKDH